MESNKTEKLDKVRQIGETVSVEFKRCGIVNISSVPKHPKFI